MRRATRPSRLDGMSRAMSRLDIVSGASPMGSNAIAAAVAAARVGSPGTLPLPGFALALATAVATLADGEEAMDSLCVSVAAADA